MDLKFLSEGWCHLQKSMEKSRLGGGVGWRSKVRRGPKLLKHLFLVFWSFLLLMSEFFRAESKSLEDEMRYLE